MKFKTSYGKINTFAKRENLLCEVIFLKRFVSALLVAIVILSLNILPLNASATNNIYGVGKVTTSSTVLNVRSAPSSTSAIKGKLNRNAYVTLISKNNNFWYVRYGESLYGYCHSDYITTVSSDVKTVKTSQGRLRVRALPSLNSTIKDYLSSGATVTVLSTDGAFSKILYNGLKTGYVHSDYLKSSGSSSVNYGKISLNVPNFKQTDSRWANVTIGSSGQTISRIGCATTALAMTESHRTGTTIYPHTMSKKLSYTSGGAVYWPTNYNVVTSSNGYLETIYSVLKSGKPVIVGAKKSDGSQHYVVVTGVADTNTLSTASFYINDPGSNTRVTLNQFFNAYPYFYKMLYAK